MKKRVLYLVLLLIMTFGFINVNAEDKGLFQVDDRLSVTGEYDGTTFFAGQTLDISAKTNGINFSAGEIVTIDGENEYAFVAGSNITMNSNIQKDLFVAGQTIVFNEKSIIGRDSYIAGSVVSLSGQFNRNSNIYASEITIKDDTVFKGDLFLDAESIVIENNVKIDGVFSYNENAVIEGFANIDDTTVIDKYEVEETDTKDVIWSELIGFCTSIVSLIVIAFVLLFLFSSLFDKIIKKEQKMNGNLKLFGVGLLTLIVMPVVSIFLLFTIFGIPISIISMICYGLFIYVSKIFVAYIIGNRVLKNKNNKYLSMTIGILIVKLLSIVPLIGGMISFIILCVGLGMITLLIIKKY